MLPDWRKYFIIDSFNSQFWMMKFSQILYVFPLTSSLADKYFVWEITKSKASLGFLSETLTLIVFEKNKGDS